ncbi:bucentaur or craniofacial development protein [Gregarina niphandrodes]|uniref:Bucentaur or craniofacial development protein n=1 Tax=Gregarina niphandrodes TaxID=110365 RepID=A0A023B6P4_GRENI|nr:bucentaur or craniofacial development protein [Gregarina niphandrodes]EZG66655.1 bucentaur or craniofacial development protein [Gregarina niphandrodes]|eukprot:XP_011130549.1 bucentaur or craniofacial development protein [Gregarina niphandrodes]
MNILSLAEDENYRSEDDEDFQEDSEDASSSEGDAHVDTADDGSVSSHKQIEELYQGMKRGEQSRLTPFSSFPSCQRIDGLVTKPQQPSQPLQESLQNALLKYTSCQPAYERHSEKTRTGTIQPDLIHHVRQTMEEETNRIQVKKVRFAGRIFEIQIDPKSSKQRLKAAQEQTEIDDINAALKDSNVQQVSAVFKSRADWQEHLSRDTDAFSLSQHRKGQASLLGQQRFLAEVQQVPMAKRRRRRL